MPGDSFIIFHRLHNMPHSNMKERQRRELGDGGAQHVRFWDWLRLAPMLMQPRRKEWH
jgi:hypothetical protein